jgi:hypothetical protein
MTPEDRDRIKTMAGSPGGKIFLDRIQKDFDKAMKHLLYCESGELASAQGKACALHEVLKIVSDAHKQ